MSLADDILLFDGISKMNETAQDILMHYGTPRHSGRYPWGSGENPYQRTGDFLSRVESLKSDKNFKFTDEDGKTYYGDTAVAKALGISTGQYRAQLAIAKAERRADQVARAKSLRADGYSFNQIAEIMGFKSDSSVRSLLNEEAEARMKQARATADILIQRVKEDGLIDVGKGVERSLGVSKERLSQALEIMRAEGYEVFGGRVPEATNPGRQITMKIVGPPGTEHKDIYDYSEIHSADKDMVSHDGGETFDPKWVYPKSMDSKRLKIRYSEEGGLEKDGLIELRRGVDDLDLGGAHYAQVRILVDGTHYLKGMAVYSDDMPDGVDVIFNTNKPKGTPALGPKDNTVLKNIKKDPDNPFGSLIKQGIVDPDNPSVAEGGQSYYIDKNGQKQLSLINKRAEEGDWGKWADKLPSQFLSKQSKTMVDRQLGMALENKRLEYEGYLELTNPVIKKALLRKFADSCDSDAEHLQAAALPRQKYQVIIPLTSIKDDEVYAPNYNDGEKVALIRFPHGGTFEIPILTVNNSSAEGKKVITPSAKDAIGIKKTVADQLSGADFDGDTVMVIPISARAQITSRQPFEGLKTFDPGLLYGGKPEGTYKPMKNTQTEMGKISNLITDMTLKGAKDSELERAVKHSMVVIDAEKHGYDYKQSEKDNGIAELKNTYQRRVDENGRVRTGASTIISRAKSEVSVPKRTGSPRTNPETGELVWQENHETYPKLNKKTGEVTFVERTQQSTQMRETKDAHTLSSGTPKEESYAEYANALKDLANKARLEIINTPRLKYDPQANKDYATEVDSLESKLRVSAKNAPRERQAQYIANAEVKAKIAANPDITKDEKKKLNQQALQSARIRTGAHRTPIEITAEEWAAIQAGAISDSKLSDIINFIDDDKLKSLASPRAKNELSNSVISRIHALSANGYTNAQIAQSLGISPSTVVKYLS